MPKTSYFVPDVRSSLGRQIVTDHFLQHRMRLNQVKPSVDCGPPKVLLARGRVAPRRAPTVEEERHIEEVRGMFYRLSHVRPSIDNSVPKTLEKVRSMTGRHKRKEETEMREHAYNIAHMQRRMIEAYSVTERRKNQYDPTVYPALLLRRPTEVFDLASTVASSSGPTRPSSAHAVRPRSASVDRSAVVADSPEAQTARVRHTFVPERASILRSASPSRSATAPAAASSHRAPPRVAPTAADFAAYKRFLIDGIVSQRLYKAADLKAFFASADAAHAHLDPGLKAAVVRDIRADLELDSDEPAE